MNRRGCQSPTITTLAFMSFGSVVRLKNTPGGTCDGQIEPHNQDRNSVHRTKINMITV